MVACLPFLRFRRNTKSFLVFRSVRSFPVFIKGGKRGAVCVHGRGKFPFLRDGRLLRRYRRNPIKIDGEVSAVPVQLPLAGTGIALDPAEVKEFLPGVTPSPLAQSRHSTYPREFGASLPAYLCAFPADGKTTEHAGDHRL